MATISERFIIDFINKKIIGTKASFDKASKGSGAIYEELATKVAKHPAFELVIQFWQLLFLIRVFSIYPPYPIFK